MKDLLTTAERSLLRDAEADEARIAELERHAQALEAGIDAARAELERRTAWGDEQIAQLQAEVARLREAERIRTLQRDDAKDALGDERAAHEATKARVAKLEQRCEQFLAQGTAIHHARRKAEAALSSARELLEDWSEYDPDDDSCEWENRRNDWLRAHPEPATPAGVYEMPLDRERNKTAPFPRYVLGAPAGTGAEPYTPEDRAIVLEAWQTLSDETRKAAWEEALRLRAEKEQKT